MNKLFLFGFFSVLVLIMFVSALDFTPQGNINMRNVYNIIDVPFYNGTDINFSGVIRGNGSLLTGISANDATWLVNWTAYNSTWSSITNDSYLLVSDWNSTNSSYLEIVNWNSTNESYATASNLSNYLLITNWNSTNTSYLEIVNWNATNTSYALDSELQNGSYFNTAETDPFWSANYSTFLTHIASLVEDLTPQLGGYLDTNTQNIGSTTDEIENIYVATDSVIFFGNGQEASITYNGTALVISG